MMTIVYVILAGIVILFAIIFLFQISTTKKINEENLKAAEMVNRQKNTVEANNQIDKETQNEVEKLHTNTAGDRFSAADAVLHKRKD